MKRIIFLTVGVAVPAMLFAGCNRLWTALQVGTGYAAKVTCSIALNSAQDPSAVLRDYVSRELTPLGSLLDVDVTDKGVLVSALGIVRAYAAYRPGAGCTLVPLEGEKTRLLQQLAKAQRRKLDVAVPWPHGEAGVAMPPSPKVIAAIEAAFREPDPPDSSRIRQTKAVLIAHDGRLVAERYAEGYGPFTPMLSWSMAKSVLAALYGIAIGEGRLQLEQPAPVPEWSAQDDPRHAITIDQLLRMSSGLEFDETYGAINDVSRMLFTQSDTGAFAAGFDLAGEPGTVWSYSSGTANILSRVLRDSFGGNSDELVRYANERLFDPVGMTSAFFEADASGTPIGSSFAFMTARDWARFGELHRLDGVWNGRRILPEGWVKYVTTPAPAAPQGCYGAHWWLNRGEPKDPSHRPWPTLPPDAYSARGHSGQYVLVVPSEKLVVVRLGLSFPDDGEEGTVQMAAAVIAALH